MNAVLSLAVGVSNFGWLFAQDGDAAAGIFGIGCMCVIGVLSLAMGAFWIWMIIDCLSKEPKDDPDRTMWMLITILLGAVGGAIYYFGRRPKRIQKYGK
jgi:hypothetical protein